MSDLNFDLNFFFQQRFLFAFFIIKYNLKCHIVLASFLLLKGLLTLRIMPNLNQLRNGRLAISLGVTTRLHQKRSVFFAGPMRQTLHVAHNILSIKLVYQNTIHFF